MEGVDTPSKPSTKDVGDDEIGVVEIASKNGDLVLHVEHGAPEPKIHSFKVSTAALKKSKYFERLLEAGRFGEGQQVASQHDLLRQKFQDITLAPTIELPSIRIVDLGRISAVKSTRPLLTDFFLIMHDKDTSSPPPVSNLANLAIVADRFDALATVRTYVRRKKFLLALDAKTQPKAEASLSEERVRQRFLVALLLDHAPWIERYSARLINRGWVGQEADVDDPLWWDLPGRVEEELAFRRDCILETIQSLQSHFLALYSSRARQCRLGYDSSPECDSFQFGEMVRFFLRAGTLSLTPTILPPEEPNQPYEGDILALLDRLKQIPEYQVDRNHSHCGIRTRLVPLADLLGAALSRVPTSLTLTAEQFEKLYLTPMMRRQPALAKQMGNPTPLALGGFVLTTTPLSCSLMAWRGASGNGIAFTGPIIFLGGLLLLVTSILEFVLGNTFPCVVFGTIGGFWFAFAATMIPAFNAAAPYSPSGTNTAAGLLSTGFMNTYAFLFITMAVLMLIFMICATRTNVIYTLIFLSLLLVFLLLSSAYWRLGLGDASVGNRCVIGAGASLFVASLLGFYLLIVQLFEAMGFPFYLPVGDLAKLWVRGLNKCEQRDVEESAAVGDS